MAARLEREEAAQYTTEDVLAALGVERSGR